MLSYELAKQLKDAGFPQDFEREDAYYLTNQGLRVHYPNQVKEVADPAYIPTLSELISACANNFGGMDHFPYEQINKFRAYSRNGISKVVYGLTPEEAVARLWLALNGSSSEASKAASPQH